MALLNEIGPWLVIAVLIGLPVALAWWLSDGFAGCRRMSQPPVYGHVFNPRTERMCVAPIDPRTGLAQAFPD